MALGQALGWAGAQSLARIALGFVSAKVSAIYLGPTGMALVGQLNSLIQLAYGAVGNGAGTGVVNLTAELRGQAERLGELWATALRIVLITSGVLAFSVSLASVPLASWLLGDGRFWPVIVVAALGAMFSVMDIIILAALNGLKQVSLIAKLGIASAFVEIGVFASLVYYFGIWGGLFGIGITCAVKLAVTCVFAYRSGLISLQMLTREFDSAAARRILRFYPMLLVHSIALPLAQILVRDGVIDGLGLEKGGYLQAVWRLSDMYVGVMTAALGLYFLAHYSALPSEKDRGAMLRRTMLQLLGLTALAASLVYSMREIIIHLVLTARFLPMAELLPLHLVGDVFKMMNYPLQMALVAQKRTSWYLAVAAGGPALFALLANSWLAMLGPQAAPAAYFASHLAVLVLLVFAQWRYLANRNRTA